MKAKKAITSLIASAMMLSAVPVNVYADNEPSIPEWVFSDIYFSPDGSKGYNFVEYRGKGNDITIPTEYNGIPVKFVEPMDFVITWKEYNPETEELTVHVPEGIDFKERSYSSYAQDYYTLSDWAGDRFNTQNFRATFIFSDGREMVYSSRFGGYNFSESRSAGSWGFDILTDENGDEYLKLLKFKGASSHITIPTELNGIPVKSIGGNLFDEDDVRTLFNFTFETDMDKLDIDPDFFHGIHIAVLFTNEGVYRYYNSDDPDIEPYLTLVRVQKQIKYPTNEDLGLDPTEFGYDYYKLRDSYIEQQYSEPNPPVLSEIAGVPVIGVSNDYEYLNSKYDYITLPDSVKYIRSNSFSAINLEEMTLPSSIKILPSNFIGSSDFSRIEGLENVMWIPRDVYTDKEYSENDQYMPKEKMLPEGISFDDPFTGFHITDENGRTYRIYMDKKDLNYYSHLIYSPKGDEDIPAEFMGFPVIDERSGKLYPICQKLVIPEDMTDISLDSFSYEQIDLPKVFEDLYAGNNTTLAEAVCGKLRNHPLSNVKELEILSNDITIGDKTFNGSGITSLTFNGNASIGVMAFGDSNINDISFTGEGSNIKISDSAFYYSHAKNLTFPEKVKRLYIGTNALSSLDITSLTLPEGTAIIGEKALSDCTKLKELIINGSPDIKDHAFSNCQSMENITFNGTPRLGYYIFANCRKLKNINIDLNTKLHGSIFDQCTALRTINGKEIFSEDGAPKAEFLDFIENNMGDAGNNYISDNYVKYRVKKIVSETISKDMNDMQKVKALHDKVCSMVNYDQQNESDKKNHTDISVFLNETSVCEGYSRAMNLLLHEAGIETYYIKAPTHAWNVVNVDGHYFHVDSTWDDDGDTISYDWFMKADNEIISDKAHSEWKLLCPSALHDFQTGTLPKCTDIMGDVDENGIVDGNDATAVLTSYVKASTGEKPTVDVTLSDVNFNGRTDAADASEILRKYAENAVK